MHQLVSLQRFPLREMLVVLLKAHFYFKESKNMAVEKNLRVSINFLEKQ